MHGLLVHLNLACEMSKCLINATIASFPQKIDNLFETMETCGGSRRVAKEIEFRVKTDASTLTNFHANGKFT